MRDCFLPVMGVLLVVLVAVTLLQNYNSAPNSTEGQELLQQANNLIPGLLNTQRIVPQAKIATEDKSKTKPKDLGSPSKLEFRSFLRTTYKSLPSDSEVLAQANGNFHHTPDSIIAASEGFGAIADRIKANSELIPEALKFYSHCGKDENITDAIRAVCLRNFMDWAGIAGVKANFSQFPSSIKSIADRLPKRSSN